MEKLFDDTLLVQKERPTRITKQQETELFLKLANEIIDQQYSDDDAETIAEDLAELSMHDSGFEMAKDLEGANASYEFTGDFIDFLDNISHERGNVLKENVKLWVKAHNPQPKLEKGDQLKISEPLSRTPDLKKDAVVYITGINMEQAYYTISADPDQKGGYVLAFEKVECQCEVLKQ